MEMPKMPDPNDFDCTDGFQWVSFKNALESWERVAKHLIDVAHQKPSLPAEETLAKETPNGK